MGLGPKAVLYLAGACLLLAQQPAPERIEGILARIRQHMAGNLAGLPNYTCLETIDRTVRTRAGEPLFADRLKAEVALIGGKEMFAWPGSSRFEYSSLDEMVTGGASGFGGFAGWTLAVFQSGQPTFSLAGEEALNGRRTLRLGFQVPLLGSGYRLRVAGREATAPYSGSAWIDAESMQVARIQVRAGETGLPLQSAGQATDYARTRIGESEFLLPAASEMAIVDLEGNEHRNSIRFSGCRQYGAESSISFDAPATAAAAPVAGKEDLRLPAGVELNLRLETPIVFSSSAVGDAVTARLDRTVKAGGIVMQKGAAVSGRIVRLEQVHRPDRHLVVGLAFFSAPAGSARATFKARLTGPRLQVRQLVDSRFYGRAPEPSGIQVKGLDIDDYAADAGTGVFRVWENKHGVERGLKMSWTTIGDRPRPAVEPPRKAAETPALASPPSMDAGIISLPALPSAEPAEPPAPLPVIRVTTRLVEVHVVVKDRQGRPVQGLTREDFTLLELGKPQPITNFSAETGSAHGGSAGDTAANQSRAATAILFDRLNTHPENQGYARRQIVSFLKEGDLGAGALYVLDSRLRVLADFAQGAAALERDLGRTPDRASVQLDASEPGAPEQLSSRFKWVEQDLARTDRAVAELALQARAELTLAALESIGHHFANAKGRKSLIWVSDGFPLSVGMSGDDLIARAVRERYMPPGSTFHFNERIARAARALTDANVAVYPVEARGVAAVGGMQAATTGAGFSTEDGGRNPRSPQPGETQRWRSKQHDFERSLPAAVIEMRGAMDALARNTGGRAFLESNDIAAGVRAAFEDAESVYVLAFQPGHGEWNGAFRRIEVRVNRPGVSVRHRTGYFAISAGKETPQERERALREACSSPLDAAGIRLEARLTGRTVALAIDAAGLVIEDSGSVFTGGFDTLFEQQAADGRALNAVLVERPLRLTRQAFQHTVSAGFEVEFTLAPVAAARILRIAVRDRASGRLGSIRVRLP
jgi:VWFA-related protein